MELLNTMNDENKLFDEIFLKRRDSNVDYALLSHPSHSWRTVSQPTYTDWLQVLDEFTLLDCFIDAREYNMSYLWNLGNLQEKYQSIPSSNGVLTGLSFLKDLELIDTLDQKDYNNLFSRFLRLVLLASELVNIEVKSPPVLSNIAHNTIHPGSTLAQAHQIIDKPLRVIAMIPKDSNRITIPINVNKVNTHINTLEQLKNSYDGKLLGFIEKIEGLISHLHLYSYHDGWSQPDQRGYVRDPDFDLVRFAENCNIILPDECDTVRATFYGMEKETEFKITDDPVLVRKLLEYGNTECFIERY
jgi:hypothetical protein